MSRIKQITIEGTTYEIESDVYGGDLMLLNTMVGNDRCILNGWDTIYCEAFSAWLSSGLKDSRSYFIENWIDDNLEFWIRNLFVEAVLMPE